MDVNGEASVEISLSDPEHSLSFADLRQIFLNVSHIIEVFRPRFDSVGGLKEPEI